MSALPAAATTLRLSEILNFSERQREAMEAADSHRYVLYGGAAGGGKSWFLRYYLLRFVIHAYVRHGVRNVRAGLFSEDYPSLKDRQISKIKHEFPAGLGEIKSDQSEGLVFKLREKLGGGFIALRNLDEPAKYQSTEFAAIGVDELTKNSEIIFHELRARLRWPGFPDGFRFPFLGATNPGGRGHEWVKRYWLDRDFPPEMAAAEFVYVPSRAVDNPFLPKAYYDELLTLPEDLRKSYAEGDWNLFKGQFFREWRHELHVVEPFAIPAWWERLTATDWGYQQPFCTLWLAIDPDGQVYVYRELYERQRDAGWLGQEHVRRSVLPNGRPERIGAKLLDPSCWDATRGPSFAEQFAAAGWGCQPADNARVSGWMRLREYLGWERDRETKVVTRRPRLRVFSSCTNLIRTLPSLPFDDTNPEDLDTDAEDHAADALRYAMMTRPALTRQPLEEMTDEMAEAHLRLLHEGAPESHRLVAWEV